MIDRDRLRNCLIVPGLFVLVCGCGSSQKEGPGDSRQAVSIESERVMNVTSSAMEEGAKIDPRFTEEGLDVSPPLAWSDVPGETKSFALICDDPDAPSPRNPRPDPWVHWILFNIPADCRELPEGVARDGAPSQVPGATQGANSWPSDNIGYRGPAPPPGSGAHRYFFKLYALDTSLDLPAGADKADLLKAMSGHVVATGQIMGTFER